MFLDFVVVVDNAQNKRLLAVLYARQILQICYIPPVTIKLGGILESLCPAVCLDFVGKILSKPFNHLQPNLVWWRIVMSRSVVPPLLSVRLSLFLSVSLLCSFDSDGTNSLKVRVDICLYMYDFLCLFRD